MNTLTKAVVGAVGFLSGYLAISGAIYLPFVVSDAKKQYREDCEYLLILGGLVLDADTPSHNLKERIKCAVGYLKENQTCFVVPCGGCFRKHQKVSEAKIIADELIKHGIDKSRIILEENSTTTVENFKFGFEIIRNHSGKDMNKNETAFLTSDFHIHRATLIAKRCGLKNPRRVSCHIKKNFIKNYAREYFCAYELFKTNFDK